MATADPNEVNQRQGSISKCFWILGSAAWGEAYKSAAPLWGFKHGVSNQTADSADLRILRLQKPLRAQPPPPTPPSKCMRTSLWAASASFFQMFFIFLLAQKIIKNLTSIKTSQNLKNQTHGCPKLDFGPLLDYFWHHFFDQFSWPPKSRNLQNL